MTAETHNAEKNAPFVIDPEDREAVERLRTILHGGVTGDRKWLCGSTTDLQRALRLAAGPRPIPPAEKGGE